MQIPTASHLLNLAKATAYSSMTDIDDCAFASGFVPCDDGGSVFVRVDVVNLTEIVTVGPILYDDTVVREVYTMDDRAEAVMTLAAALDFRRVEFPF